MPDLSYDPLTPLSFLDRAASVFGDRIGVVDGPRRTTYAELGGRVRRLSGFLQARGVRPGDRVAVLARNRLLALEAPLGIAGAGGVVVALNTRSAASELAGVVDHAEPKVLLVEEALAPLGRDLVERSLARPLLVEVGEEGSAFEHDLASAPPLRVEVTDELAPLAINYTSGTTGSPKGVVYHHRGAYLQALAMAVHAGLSPRSVFLWTLPMFHCNGWCFPWAVTAVGATHVCLPAVDAAEVWSLIAAEGVTHLNAAPTVLTTLVHHPDATPQAAVRVATGGSPPSPTLIARARALGFEVTHLYGLTETYGPSVICDWHPEWDDLDLDEQARRLARQGVPNVVSHPVRVVDAAGGDVPADGVTVGEVALRGNNVMAGYFRDEEATRRAAPGGWFRTGDLAVMHPDGYLEVCDRAKDIIISGGENISSVEVEQVLASHPAVREVAVVAAADERWGEVPVAFVTLGDGEAVSVEELQEHVRDRLARFKVPRRIIFGELPKTATGKIQKFRLRQSLLESAGGGAPR